MVHLGGMSLLIEHGNLFAIYMHQTYEALDKCLTKLRYNPNREVKYLALKGTEAYFSIISNLILEEKDVNWGSTCLKVC
jgi:hypothetical protein